MHKDDQMTPLERLNGFLTGGEMDRILAMPFICSMSGKAAGMTHREKRATARSEADCQIANYKRFGNDLLIVEYGLHTVGKAIGTKMADPDDAVPHITDRILKDLNDVDNLDWEKALPQNSPDHQKHLEALKICIDEAGNEVPTGVLISCPFTAAASIYDTEKLLKACRRNPEGVHKLIRGCTDVLKELHNDYIKAGGMILLCEPIATGSIINQKTFHEFVEPYMTELIENIKDKGGMCCYHICGDTTKVLDNMLASKPHMISVDNRVDLAWAKSKVEPFMPIVGNVDPVDTMILGTPEDVDRAVKEKIQTAYDAKNGYILASGCDLNGDVPLENLDAFMAAARKYGKCPVGPQNWA